MTNHVASNCFKRLDVNFHGLENTNGAFSQSGGSSAGPPRLQAHFVESRPHDISSPSVSYLHTSGTFMPSSQSTGSE